MKGRGRLNKDSVIIGDLNYLNIDYKSMAGDQGSWLNEFISDT